MTDGQTDGRMDGRGGGAFQYLPSRAFGVAGDNRDMNVPHLVDAHLTHPVVSVVYQDL